MLRNHSSAKTEQNLFYFFSTIFLTVVNVAMTAGNLKTSCSPTVLQFSMLLPNGTGATLLQILEGQAS